MARVNFARNGVPAKVPKVGSKTFITASATAMPLRPSEMDLALAAAKTHSMSMSPVSLNVHVVNGNIVHQYLSTNAVVRDTTFCLTVDHVSLRVCRFSMMVAMRETNDMESMMIPCDFVSSHPCWHSSVYRFSVVSM